MDTSLGFQQTQVNNSTNINNDSGAPTDANNTNVQMSNGVNVLGVWYTRPITVEDMQNMKSMDVFPGNVFIVGSAAEVVVWTSAARESCKRFRDHIKSFIAQENQLASSQSGAEKTGTEAFIQSCRILL